jgi:hypothetical protein
MGGIEAFGVWMRVGSELARVMQRTASKGPGAATATSGCVLLVQPVIAPAQIKETKATPLSKPARAAPDSRI